GWAPIKRKRCGEKLSRIVKREKIRKIFSKSILKKGKIGGGMFLTEIVTATLLGSAIAKIAGVPQMVDGLTHAGIPRGAVVPIAVLELSCLALYLFPRSSVLGALLLTGYFG